MGERLHTLTSGCSTPGALIDSTLHVDAGDIHFGDAATAPASSVAPGDQLLAARAETQKAFLQILSRPVEKSGRGKMFFNRNGSHRVGFL